MGFTLAHIALSKPLRRWSKHLLTYTALAIGTIMPDIEYLLNMRMFAKYGTSLQGMLYFQVPLGIILFFYAYKIAIPILQEEMRLPKYDYSKKEVSLLMIFAALLVGIASHMVWDIFTHESGYYAQIKNPIAELWQTTSKWTPAYFCQIVTSIIGLVFLGIQWIAYLKQKHIRMSSISWRPWYIIAVVALVLFLVRATMGFNPELFVADVLSAAMGACFYAIIAYTLFQTARKI